MPKESGISRVFSLKMRAKIPLPSRRAENSGQKRPDGARKMLLLQVIHPNMDKGRDWPVGIRYALCPVAVIYALTEVENSRGLEIG